MTASAPILTWLFVPGDRPERIEKAIASRAHAVIVDLEDGVPAREREDARKTVAARLAEPVPKPVYVRVNPHDDADLAVAAALPIAGVVVPKVEAPSDLPAGVEVLAMLESALALERAFEIASHGNVRGIALGEADLRSATGAAEAGVDWARSRVVNAAVAAGLPRPAQAVYMNVRDLDGLAASCRRGRELGHLGRQAIHPGQLEVIERAYLPTESEVEHARATLELLAGTGTGELADGAFVDNAVLGSAEAVVALADAYGTVS